VRAIRLVMAVGRARVLSQFFFQGYLGYDLSVTQGKTRGRATMTVSLKGAHFPQDIILMMAVRLMPPLSAAIIKTTVQRSLSAKSNSSIISSNRIIEA
jgi:hypothetical protein